MKAALALLCLVLLVAAHSPARGAEEPPALAEAVAAGRLPPLSERLPASPRRDLPTRPDWAPGQHGGSLTMLDRGGRDARALVVFGYARLMAWQRDEAGIARLVPDILETVEVEDGRSFTLSLRGGHRWSDGAPFTSEDFRFWWQDIATDPDLSPGGPPSALLVDGKPPIVEILDRARVRFSWPKPNNRFLPALAGTSPTFIYAPAHYLKRFHPRYREAAALQAEAEAAGQPDWVARFRRLDVPFRYSNPERPSLQPWINTVQPPSERFIGRRNPYFHRVDGAGRQLPYLDEVIIAKTQARLIPAQAAAGQSGLQSIGLGFGDAALLKEAEARGAISLRLWPIGRGAQLALYPNLNAADPAWRALLQSVDFRRALSLAIDRAELVSVVYKGFAIGGGNAVLPGSPLYDPALRDAWAGHDPARAEALLDGLDLPRGSDGIRRMAGGDRLGVVVETGDTDPDEVSLLELVRDHWAAVGVELLIRPQGRQAFRERVQAGAAVMTVFYGLADGFATAESNPAELAPTSDRQNNWPRWGRYGMTGGRRGEAPDLPAVQRLSALHRAWSEAVTTEARRDAWREMLAIHAEQVFTIGLIGQVLQPVAADPRLRNLPAEAPYLYEPGAYFGIYRPDTFWLGDAE